MKKVRALDLAYMGLFVALIAVCSWISIPIGELKYTLQVLAVLLCGALLGWKRGLVAVLAYVLLGAVGVPVFSNFTRFLIYPTSGYVVGFIFTVVIVGLGYKIEFKNQNKALGYTVNLLIRLAFMAVGVAVCYAFGTAWFMIYRVSNDNAVSLVT
ncbi:MAG: biotin transporter BioY, partial [Clostridia bacterium]|nr:biotin transporter BioY [Clostridia bacterium]